MHLFNSFALYHRCHCSEDSEWNWRSSNRLQTDTHATGNNKKQHQQQQQQKQDNHFNVTRGPFVHWQLLLLFFTVPNSGDGSNSVTVTGTHAAVERAVEAITNIINEHSGKQQQKGKQKRTDGEHTHDAEAEAAETDRLYAKFQKDIDEHARRRGELFDEASKEYEKGNKARAAELRDLAKEEGRKMEEAQKKASRNIFNAKYDLTCQSSEQAPARSLSLLISSLSFPSSLLFLLSLCCHYCLLLLFDSFALCLFSGMPNLMSTL